MQQQLSVSQSLLVASGSYDDELKAREYRQKCIIIIINILINIMLLVVCRKKKEAATRKNTFKSKFKHNM